MTNGYPHLSTESVLTERFPYDVTALNCYDTHTSPHWHNFTQILYVMKGFFFCTINGEEYFCPQGSVVFMYPYTTHKLDLSKTDFDESYILQINMGKNPKGFCGLTYEKGVFCDKTMPCVVILPEEKKLIADEFCSDIVKEYEKKNDMRINRIEKFISEILSLCADYINSPVAERKLASEIKRAKEITVATEFIKDRCKENLTVCDVTEFISLSRSDFMEKFKAVTGITFNEYFSRVRAYEALSVLRYSTKSVAQVAEEFGYSSDARFIHSCARLFKKSPLQIKKHWMKHDKMHGIDIHRVDEKEQAWKNVWSEDELYIRRANAEVKY